MVRVEFLFDRLADVSVTGSYAGHQHFLSSFSLVLVSFLLLDLEHDLKEVPNMPKELDPARHHGAVFTFSYISFTSIINPLIFLQISQSGYS